MKDEDTAQDSTAQPPAPQAILAKIKNAWIAGLVAAAITLIVSATSLYGTTIQGFDAWNFVDVALALSLSFGIYKRSRAAAVTMLAYFVISKIVIIVDTGTASGIFVALVFLYFYWQGVVGTFAYHRHIKRLQPSSSSDA